MCFDEAREQMFGHATAGDSCKPNNFVHIYMCVCVPIPICNIVYNRVCSVCVYMYLYLYVYLYIYKCCKRVCIGTLAVVLYAYHASIVFTRICGRRRRRPV